MVDVTTQIVIDRPAALVAAYATDPNRAPEWYENIKSVEWKTPQPLTLGSKVAFVAHFMGKKLAYAYEIVKFTGDEFVMRTAEGPFPMETTYTFRQADTHSTLMTLRNRGNPSGFSKLFAPFMAMMMRRANNKDLQRLKAILEKD